MAVKNRTAKLFFLASCTLAGLAVASPARAADDQKIVTFTPAPGMTPSSSASTSTSTTSASASNTSASSSGSSGTTEGDDGLHPGNPDPIDRTLDRTLDRASFARNLAKLQADKEKEEAQRQADLGTLDNPDSARYKADKLAEAAKKQRADDAALGVRGLSDAEGLDNGLTPPPDVSQLQDINKYQAGAAHNVSDDPINKELALDMRKNAQKEAALSYGARGGLAKRNYEIMEQMRGFDGVLDRVFNFRQLLVKAPSGLLIEPPIVSESANALVITSSGDEAAVADRVYDINKKAKIVSAPRDWRTYLLQSWSDVPPPPHVLWPRTLQEQADWDGWVASGWDAGLEQADQIFEANVNRLTADYNGMVRYRMLLAQGMISAPFAMHEDRGITGDPNQMRVGDRAVRITGPSQFLTKAELWKPADR